METLKRRAEALAREIDLRRKAAGEPSVLDLRPVGGPEVDVLLAEWRQILTIDSTNGRAEVPYERISHVLDRHGYPEIRRRAYVHLTDLRNKWIEDQREDAK